VGERGWRDHDSSLRATPNRFSLPLVPSLNTSVRVGIDSPRLLPTKKGRIDSPSSRKSQPGDRLLKRRRRAALSSLSDTSHRLSTRSRLAERSTASTSQTLGHSAAPIAGWSCGLYVPLGHDRYEVPVAQCVRDVPSPTHEKDRAIKVTVREQASPLVVGKIHDAGLAGSTHACTRTARFRGLFLGGHWEGRTQLFFDLGECLGMGMVMAPSYGGISGAFLRASNSGRMAATHGLRQPLIELSIRIVVDGHVACPGLYGGVGWLCPQTVAGTSGGRAYSRGSPDLSPAAPNTDHWTSFVVAVAKAFRSGWYPGRRGCITPLFRDQSPRHYRVYRNREIDHSPRAVTADYARVLFGPVSQLLSLIENTPAASHVLADAPDQHGGVISTLQIALMGFRFLPPESSQTWSARAWQEQRPEWLFLPCRESERAAVSSLQTLWLDALIRRLLDTALARAQRECVWIVIDELATLRRLQHLEDILTRGRKRGVAVVMGFQAVPQLRKLYGRDTTATLLAAPAVKLLLRTGEPETARWCSDAIGNREVIRPVESETAGPEDRRQRSRSQDRDGPDLER
jgi:hypothetical protein